MDALGDAAADLAPVVGEMMRHEGAVIASGRFGDNPESSLRTSAYAFDLLLQHAREAGITDAFPRYAAETFRRGLDAGYGEEETAALIKALR